MDLLAPTSVTELHLLDDTWTCMRSTPSINTFDWIRHNIAMPDGVPFDADAFPWTRGICEAWDNPDVKRIWLQFAARLGKTAIAQSLMIARIAHKPSPALYGTSTEGLAKQTVKLKLLKMLRETTATRKWVPPEHQLLQTRLDLMLLTIYVSWSGSATTLADIDPATLHGGEIDKWTTDESIEADSLDLFLERGIERPDQKCILESTPALDGQSRINAGLINGWNCRFHVPCINCDHHQQLVICKNAEPTNGGLWWDRTSDGSHPDPEEAARTARYICPACRTEIDDEFRRPMIRRGVWVPEGQWADKKGRLQGEARNSGPEASFQLSRIYAPSFTFGEIAREYVKSRESLSKEQNFANSWEGETFVRRRRHGSWDEVARRLCRDYDPLVLPEDVVFLTAGCDVQSDHLVWMVYAWSRNKMGREIAHDVAVDWGELWHVLSTPWKHELGGELPIAFTLIDSRHRPDEVKDFCRARSRKGRWIMPAEGQRSTSTMSGRMFRRVPLEQSDRKVKKRSPSHFVELVKVNTNETQQWLDSCLYRRRPGDVGSILFPRAAEGDRDLFEQMVNEIHDEEKNLWIPAMPSVPWDFRDCTRYARVAAEVFTRSDWSRLLPYRPPNVVKADSQPPRRDPEQSHQGAKKWKLRKMTGRRM